MSWRTGRTVLRTVYENDQIMFLCTTPEEATRVVALLNRAEVTDNQLAAKDAAYVELDLKQRDTQAELDCALSESAIAGKRIREPVSSHLQRERELSDKLAAALKSALFYREHSANCEIEPTDFCNCGLNTMALKSDAALAQHAAARGGPD